MGCMGLGARVSHNLGMGHMTNRSIDRVLDWNPHYLMQNNHCTMLCYAASHIESPWTTISLLFTASGRAVLSYAIHSALALTPIEMTGSGA